MSKLLSKEQSQLVSELRRNILNPITGYQLQQLKHTGKITNDDFHEYHIIVNGGEECDDYELELIERVNRVFLKQMLGNLYVENDYGDEPYSIPVEDFTAIWNSAMKERAELSERLRHIDIDLMEMKRDAVKYGLIKE